MPEPYFNIQEYVQITFPLYATPGVLEAVLLSWKRPHQQVRCRSAIMDVHIGSNGSSLEVWALSFTARNDSYDGFASRQCIG
jgi:hypothetical protein